jgi:two-component system NtrC family sensor kinase
MQETIVQAERMASLGQLVAGMAHEMNNPLTSIVGFSEILASDDTLHEDARSRIQLMFMEGERVRNIVNKLLTFAQSPQANGSGASINKILGETLDLVENDLKKEDVQLITSFEDVPPAPGDIAGYRQAFLALITNALQALEGKSGDGRLIVKTWRIENEIHVSIGDNGIGIPQDKVSRIFDPFYTSKEVGKGTGLGLSICYKIVSAQGGRISVDSKPGKGTTFEVILPVAQ